MRYQDGKYVLKVPSLYDRFWPLAWKTPASAGEAGQPHGAGDTTSVADLQLVSAAIRHRRNVLKQTKHRLKADLPLSVADLPLLVALMRGEDIRYVGTQRGTPLRGDGQRDGLARHTRAGANSAPPATAMSANNLTFL